jgi:ribose 5-phosphate isomerase B
LKIAVANDHVAVDMKHVISQYLSAKGHEVINFGTDSTVACDYPVVAETASLAVVNGEADCGVLICGTGLGMSIAANKVRGIRAAVCSEPYSAMRAKTHNNANIICFGARVIGPDMAKMIVDSWLEAEFEAGRHAERVNLITKLETRQKQN